MPVFEFPLSKRPAPVPAQGKPAGRPPDLPGPKPPRRKPGPKPRSPLSTDKRLLVDKTLMVESEGEFLKDKMTLPELQFISNFLVSGMKRKDALISAGYQFNSESTYTKAGKRIIEKYESQAGDHRKIFRAVGAGEVAVAQGLLEIAQGPYPADVRRKAWADIASCLGLKSEVIESFQGMSINIRGMTPTDPGKPGLEVEVAPALALPPPFKGAQVVE